MTSEYTRHVLKVVVAQICQTIGWHAINSSPLEFMVDLMQEYILRISKLSHDYAEHFGRTEVNLDDLGLAFRSLNIDLDEIAEYVRNVDPVPCAVAVPKLPIHKENHLNFLKPGSREVVTRPVHVHEHLPPMYPENEEDYPDVKPADTTNSSTNSELTNLSEDDPRENTGVTNSNAVLIEDDLDKTVSQAVFKRPGDPISAEGSALKRPKVSDNGRPLREIHSVIMTTSGFLSTAREGKLPEARTPHQERVRSPTPPIENPIIAPAEIPVEKKLKKIPKKTAATEEGKPENKENKKKKIPKETLFEPDKVKKLTGVKDKVTKSGTKCGKLNLASSSLEMLSGKMSDDTPKLLKNNLTVNKIKSEKTMDIMQSAGNLTLNDTKDETIEKLPTAVSHQKLNIFKKISSKPKETLENSQQKLKDSAPNLIMPNMVGVNEQNDDKKLNMQNHLTNNNAVRLPEGGTSSIMSPNSDDMYAEISPPRTPGNPKTPDMNLPAVEQRKKKKDKSGKKKEQKNNAVKSGFETKKARLSNDSVSSEMDILDRPKTPQAPEHPISRDPNLPSTPMNPFPFFPLSSAPGLIPRPMFPPYGPVIGGPNPAIIRPNIPHLLRPPNKLDPMNRPTGMVPPFIPEANFSSKQQPSPLLPSQQLRMAKPLEREPTLPANLQIPDMSTPLPIVNNVGVTGLTSMDSQPTLSSAVVPASLLPSNSSIEPETSINKPVKPEKADKALKKLKEHKKDKKDKLKKKKEKKEKHKDKGEKIKEKKDKSEKKDKLEKLREKKEKKEKRKEKEAIKKIKEEKIMEAVPKITLKWDAAAGSPRASTPDSALTKKITIKPPKKPDEEVKREASPEIARFSALVTGPRKQKTSKKLDDGLLEAYSMLPTEASFSNSLNPTSRVKKPKFKPMPVKNSVPNLYNQYLNPYDSSPEIQKTQYCFIDQAGRTVWICPACGKQDDGSAMIGCDDCDAWYHWVCVGIQVAPAENEDWYCRMCIVKKQEEYSHDKKKKKRKKKNPVA